MTAVLLSWYDGLREALGKGEPPKKLEPTKGQSKITADQVIAARKLKVAEPALSMQAIKDRLKLKLSTIMVGRAIRGITHRHLDMVGLPIRPMVSRDLVAEVEPVAPAKRAAKKAAVKAAANEATAKRVRRPKKTVPAAAA